MRRTMISVLVALMCAFACTVSGFAAESSATPVKVGVVLPLTGKQAKFGEIEKNSFLIALDEINKAGGVKGRPIDLIIEDDTSKPNVGRSAVEKLVSQDKVVVLGGGYSSSVTYAMAAVAQQRKIPFVVNTGSADKITEQKWDYVFRLNPPASEYFLAVMPFLEEVVKPKSVAILYENSLFGQSQSKYFAAACEKKGMKVVLKEGYEQGALDFKPLLIKTKSKNPGVVYMISYVMDAALLVRQAKELNFTPKALIGGAAGFTLPEFAKNAGPAAEYVFSATLWTPRLPFPGAQAYFEKYKKKYGGDTEYHGAEAYACLYVIKDALERAKEMTPQAVREALTKTDMKTAFGPVKFVSYDNKTQQNRLVTYMGQWQNGVFETVWPKSVASKPYVYPVPVAK